MVAAGNTTISAVFEGNDTYEAQTVTYTLTVNAGPELPEEGTMYDFTGYLTEDAAQPSSTGTIEYLGVYNENTDYVYGRAIVTFTGSNYPQSMIVYMTKDDLFDALDGNRAEVFIRQNNQFVSIGYGEMTEHVGPTFGTLNITVDPTNASFTAEVETSIDWTDKTVIAQDEAMNVYIQMIPDANDSTKLVLDNDFTDKHLDDLYLAEHPTGALKLTVQDSEETYNVAYAFEYVPLQVNVDPMGQEFLDSNYPIPTEAAPNSTVTLHLAEGYYFYNGEEKTGTPLDVQIQTVGDSAMEITGNIISDTVYEFTMPSDSGVRVDIHEHI